MIPPDNQATVTQRILYVLLNSLALGFALFIVLLVLWARAGIESAISGRENDMAIRAVLKQDVKDAPTRAFVDRLAKETQGLDVALIGRAEARSLLALQEPWMKNLPEIDVGELPAMVEIHHPALLRSRKSVETFVDRLAREPEVEFVVFNATGYDKLIRFVAAVRSYARFIGGAIIAATAVLFVLLNIGCARLKGTHPVGTAFAFAAGIAGPGILLAVVLFGVARLLAAHRYPGIGSPSVPQVVACALAAACFCLLLELKDARRRRVRKVRRPRT
jgi:hypothetical protein